MAALDVVRDDERLAGRAHRRKGLIELHAAVADLDGKLTKDQLSPQALGDWQKAEIAKWWPMIKSANVKVD